jgi:hypothetical protein
MKRGARAALTRRYFLTGAQDQNAGSAVGRVETRSR